MKIGDNVPSETTLLYKEEIVLTAVRMGVTVSVYKTTMLDEEEKPFTKYSYLLTSKINDVIKIMKKLKDKVDFGSEFYSLTSDPEIIRFSISEVDRIRSEIIIELNLTEQAREAERIDKEREYAASQE